MNETAATNDEALLLTRLVVQKIVTPIVVLVGVIGNSLSVIVLTRKCMMKSSTNSYLTALAMFDLLYLLFSFTLSFKHYPEAMSSPVYVHWFPFARVFTDMASNVSVTLTVTFTVERYIGVCHPMRGRTLCTPQRAKMITLLVSLVAILCTVPEFWELEVVSYTNDSTNITELGLRYTSFAHEPAYDVGYYWFLVLVFTFLPLVMLCVFNGILILTLIRAAKLRRQMTILPKNTKFSGNNRYVSNGTPSGCGAYRVNSVYGNNSNVVNGASGGYGSNKSSSSHAKEQQKITKMLITVVLVFIICQLPGSLLLSYQTYLSLRKVILSRYHSNLKKILANVTNLLVSINASINFILYSAISIRFRRVFYRIFCSHNGKSWLWSSRKQQLNSMVESRTDAIQMSSFYEANGTKHMLHRQPLIYKSRPRINYRKESNQWPDDSCMTSAAPSGITFSQQANYKGTEPQGYHHCHKTERNPCFYS